MTSAWGPDALPPPDEELSHFAISKLMAAVEREPEEFVFHYMLADHLQRAGQIAEPVRVARRACRIAPSDPRATYALGTTLRTLSRAKYGSAEFANQLPGMIQFFERLGEVFDPRRSQDALDELEMSIGDSVREAIAAFEETLERGVRRGERRIVRDDLAAVRGEFPEHI